MWCVSDTSENGECGVTLGSHGTDRNVGEYTVTGNNKRD